MQTKTSCLLLVSDDYDGAIQAAILSVQLSVNTRYLEPSIELLTHNWKGLGTFQILPYFLFESRHSHLGLDWESRFMRLTTLVRTLQNSLLLFSCRRLPQTVDEMFFSTIGKGLWSVYMLRYFLFPISSFGLVWGSRFIRMSTFVRTLQNSINLNCESKFYPKIGKDPGIFKMLPFSFFFQFRHSHFGLGWESKSIRLSKYGRTLFLL